MVCQQRRKVKFPHSQHHCLTALQP